MVNKSLLYFFPFTHLGRESDGLREILKRLSGRLIKNQIYKTRKIEDLVLLFRLR
jgi:hypothetical protein